MTTTCTRCGAQLAGGQKFCTSCGASQSQSPSPAQKFCVGCGSPLGPGAKFCNRCGTSAEKNAATPAASNFAANPPAQPPATPEATPNRSVPPPEPGPAAQPAPPAQPALPMHSPAVPVPDATRPPVPASPTAVKKGGGCGTILVVLLVVVGLVVAAGIVGTIYVAHKVKQKAHELITKASSDITARRSSLPDVSDVAGSFPVNKPLVDACPDAAPAAGSDSDSSAAKVPLREGLTWVIAWRRFNGDVEIINNVTATAPNYVNTSNSGLGFTDSQAVQGRELVTSRTICRADLQSASTYTTKNEGTFPQIIPHTTNFSLSQNSLRQLKENGKITITYLGFEDVGHLVVPVPQTAELTRVEPADIDYPVILNGQATTLPVIHAQGHYRFTGDERVKKRYNDPSFLDEDGEIFVVDDPANPFMLLWKMGAVFQIRVVSITFPVDHPKPQIEEALAKEKKAVIYGIYFDFNQATIKKESQPVLKEIAEAMKNNPDWVLTVNGHTDNIGGGTYNLDLSKRRAAAVKNALVEQYGIAPERLTTGGAGSSSPVDTNETLEGRARNRRVELIRR